MISNEAIRQEVIELLQGNIQGIQHFHNGRAVFTDVENELLFDERPGKTKGLELEYIFISSNIFNAWEDNGTIWGRFLSAFPFIFSLGIFHSFFSKSISFHSALTASFGRRAVKNDQQIRA